MMYKHVIDEIIAKKEEELKKYRKGYRLTKFQSQLEAAEHVQKCIDSLKRLRRKAPSAPRVPNPDAVDAFMPRDNPTLEELLAGYQRNIPRL